MKHVYHAYYKHLYGNKHEHTNTYSNHDEANLYEREHTGQQTTSNCHWQIIRKSGFDLAMAPKLLASTGWIRMNKFHT